jgi:hypothetical protein
MSEERRTAPRYSASLPGELDTSEDRTSIAITRDVSSSGLLVLSRKEIAAGTPVSLKIAFRGKDLTVTGKVVRHEEVAPEESSLWLYKIAVVLDSSPVFDEVMAELAEQATHPPDPDDPFAT